MMEGKLMSPQFNNYPPHSFMKDFKQPIQYEKHSRKECINYIHVPYCNERCGYCILSSVIRDASKLGKEIELIKKEIDLYSDNIKDREVVAALWGGGTPSLLLPEQIEDLYGHARKKIKFSEHAEITVEVKPGTLNNENIEAFKACGVNRISFGVQTLNEEELKYCNRNNSVDIVYNTMDLAAKHGLNDINFDLLIGIPTQTVESFKTTCEQVFSHLRPNHASLYILIVHPKTYFARLYEKNKEMFAGDETKKRMYDVFFDTAAKYNYTATSPLNVAKNSALRSKYQYYNWKGYERIAIGPEAIGYCGETQYINLSWRDEKYEELLNASELPVKCSYNLSKDELLRRSVILGLQNLELNLEEMNSTYGLDVLNHFDSIWKLLIEKQLIEKKENILHLTPSGRKLLYYIQTLFYDNRIELGQQGIAGVIIKEIEHVNNPVEFAG
ncbi:MAG: coproporphyrinogen III oxidase family protein [Clostridia bacterium]|nr:coproporphyrinogen III oxidase family protein [Clostridia bacterium]